MSEALLILDQLNEELTQFKSLPMVPWQNANRAQLVERLKQWQTHTRQAKELITLLQLEQLKIPGLKDLHFKEAETHLRKNQEVLERNLAFEKDKTNRRIDLTEKVTTPALGADLEGRMHKQWLALQRLQEHAHITLRKALDSPTSAKKIEGDLFALIRTKEEEIQKIKEERDHLKREKYFGPTEKYSLTEMENELQELLQQFAIEKYGVFDHLEQGKKKLEEYNVHHLHLENKTKKLEHMVHELTKKHISILTLLKKERDFARKLALDLETETASLRALYSKELLTLEEKKHALKQEAEEKHAHKIVFLEGKVKEQESLIRELDALVREKERQLAKLAEKLPSELKKERENQPARSKKTPWVN